MPPIDLELDLENEFCKSNDFEQNEHGQYIYASSNGKSSFNMPDMLSDYTEFLITKGYKITKP